MKFTDLKKSLKSGQVASCYILQGDDSFLVDLARTMICDLVTEYRDMNIDTREFTSASEFAMALNQIPLMSAYRVVHALSGKTDLKQAIADFLKSPPDGTVLLLTPPAEEKISFDSAVKVDCNRLSRDYVLAWVKRKADEAKVSVTNGAFDELFVRCGGYLSRISSETDKLFSMGKAVIERFDVSQTVAATLEYKTYELSSDILSGNKLRALSIVADIPSGERVPLVNQLYNRFRLLLAVAVSPQEDVLQDGKISSGYYFNLKKEASKSTPRRLKAYCDMLSAIDEGIKSGTADDKLALEALILSA